MPTVTASPTQTVVSFSLREFTNGPWLEQQDPQLASSIKKLGWIQDGIDVTESKAIQDLLYIAVTSRSVVAYIVSLSWVQDGIHEVEAGAFRWLNNIGSAEVASSVVSLGWIEDGIDAVEVEALENLSYIANKDTGVGLSIITLGWIQDGIADLEAGAIDWLKNIASAEVALSVVSLGWVEDGIDAVEVEALENLSYIANKDTGVGLSIITLGWIQDGIADLEAGAIDWLKNIASAEVALSVVSLGWMQDGITETEVEAIKNMSYIANKDTGVGLSIITLGWIQDGIADLEAGAIDWLKNIASAEVALSVVSLGWVEDGIDAVEVEALENLSYIANKDTGVGLSIITLGWIQDGIADLEAGAIDWLKNIASAEVALSVVSLGWMQDGITETEVEAIRYLGYIANDNTVASERISKMPFLTAIEPVDISALDALSRLAGYREESLEQILAHPSLTLGISDTLTPIVAMLDGVAKTNPTLIDTLLDSDSVNLERRSIALPLTGDVDLAIVRTRPGSARSMELLERSVRASEELMGKPFPTRFVGLLYEDAVSEGVAGTNFGTHIAVLPKYDVDDGSHEAEFAPPAIAHEVAHYFWSGNADWIDEGIAIFMASTVENKRTGKPVRVTTDPCAYARSIAELKALAPDRDADLCNYSLGGRLFVDMYRTIGDNAVWKSLRELYDRSLVEDYADDLKWTALDIKHLREVFQSSPGAAVSIGRWYDGTEDYDLSQLD